MFIYYVFNIVPNFGSIYLVHQVFTFSENQAVVVDVVATISIIIHYFIIQKYRKIAFEPVTNKEKLGELSSTTSRLDSLRYLTYFVAPILVLIFYI